MGQIMKRPGRPQNQYLSISNAAKILGMSRTAVYKQVMKGEIKSIRIGKTYGIPQSSLAEIRGGPISPAKKKRINRAVKKVVKEYAELLRKLGNE